MVIIAVIKLNVLLTHTGNPVNQWEFKANPYLSLVFPRRIDGYYSRKGGKTITST